MKKKKAHRDTPSYGPQKVRGLKVWRNGSKGRPLGVMDLTKQAQAILGLWIVGVRDDAGFRDHIPAGFGEIPVEDIAELIHSHDPTIKRLMGRREAVFWVDIRGSVQCCQCGRKINVVPCLVCNAVNATPVWDDAYNISPPPAAPTLAAPGTPEKIKVLQERVASGVSLWHPKDAAITAPDENITRCQEETKEEGKQG